MRDQLSLGLDDGDTTRSLLPGAVLLRRYAEPAAAALLADIEAVAQAAPFRQMETPGGLTMAVALSNCGELGWVSDRRGYRYTREDPASGKAWPAMPASFRTLAEAAAASAGFSTFAPDACLMNRYLPGVRLSLHQDKDERDFTAPIVSVSLGLPATFLFGGLLRGDKTLRVPLAHGDVVVWGGPARLLYHGVLPIKPGAHPVVGERRLNLTFRKAAG